MLFVRAAMASDAVFDILNAFLPVSSKNLGLLMLVASITGEFLEIATDVTSRAWRVVVAIEQEKLCMVERGRPPLLRGVALSTTIGIPPDVQCIHWRCMATPTVLQIGLGQQRMLKSIGVTKRKDVSLMIAVTGQTVLLDQ
jgi:hypothetical protein